ncbi:adenylyl cyclase-associated protein [Clonorchis sinensis]|uniref:Adenylyl cyclase-associated protein n=1 Tax=Clonorchis sinensis TaxID=79923 RepID=H2KTN2_CLOSI|nr:adenylyl cyclase-associated protein [Clonorchis sinensis]
MSKKFTLFSCFSGWSKPLESKKVTKFHTRDRSESLADLPSITELSRVNAAVTKSHCERDGSARETVSLSTASQIPVLGDTTSASLGGWSSVHHPEGSADLSKINLLASEDSCSLIRPILGALSRSNELSEECYERLELLVQRLEHLAGIRSTVVDSRGLLAFQALIDKVLPHYLVLSTGLGPEVKQQSLRVREAFELVRNLVKLSITYVKPTPTVWEEYYKPVSYKLLEIAPTSSILVKEIREATNAFANKAFQYCYSSHATHTEWIRAWMACIKGVQDVVDTHFRYGLTWLPEGPKVPPPPKAIRPMLMYDNGRVASNRTTTKVLHTVLSNRMAVPLLSPINTESTLLQPTCSCIYIAQFFLWLGW